MADTLTVDVIDASGKKAGTTDLPAEVFDVQTNVPLIHQVVVAQLAAARQGTASTKTRGEVSGGGRKPYKQKGTGRARQGSTRAPQFAGGGVVHGPTPRDYSQRTPKKMVRLALRSALSDRAASGHVALVDAWTFETPRTKDAIAALDALGLAGRVLVVLDADDGIADRSFANLQNIQTIQVGELNAYDILVNDWLVFTDATLPTGGEASAEAASAGDEGSDQ